MLKAFMRAVSTSNAHQTLKGKPPELQTLLKGFADWLSSRRSTPIGRNWGPCDIINISFIENLLLIETVGLYGRRIVNRWHRKPRDHCTFTNSKLELKIIFRSFVYPHTHTHTHTHTHICTLYNCNIK
jgi:hypothetical protein